MNPDQTADGADDLGGFEIPDDLSGLSPFGGETASTPTLAIVLTQVAGAEPLAAACALAKVTGDVFATSVGAVLVCRDLTGDAPARDAAAVSQVVRGVPAILVERREGQLTAARFQDGARGDDLPAGLVLDGAPAELEDLLLGATSLADMPDVLPTDGISRLKAARLLGGFARKMRRSS